MEDEISSSRRQLLHTIVLIQVMLTSGSLILLACRIVADNSDGRYSSKHTYVGNC